MPMSTIPNLAHKPGYYAKETAALSFMQSFISDEQN